MEYNLIVLLTCSGIPLIHSYFFTSSPLTQAKSSNSPGIFALPFLYLGDVIRNRLLCAEKLTQDDASLKNTLYSTIANQAVELRTPQARYTHRFNTNNYMEALAQQLGKDKICREIFLNLTVDESKVASYQLKPPFDVLLKHRQQSLGRTSQNYIELYKHIIQNLEWFNHAKDEIEAILEKEQVTPESKFTPITL